MKFFAFNYKFSLHLMVDLTNVDVGRLPVFFLKNEQLF